jgi:murein DD-endopeptidase MepM/ murein hydrolase activator NlpD
MPWRCRFALCLALVCATNGASAAETEHQLTVRPGDTLAALLESAKVERAEAHQAITALTPHFPPRALAIGQELSLRVAPGQADTLRRLEIATAPGRSVVLRRAEDGWSVEERAVPRIRHLARIEASLDGGVFPGLLRAGLPGPLVQDLIRALSHEIDFERDLQPGDRIAVAVERLRGPEGELLAHGEALHVVLMLSGTRLELWRHEDAWFREDGRPLAGGFLRTPLDGARLTSGFGRRRHPVLGFSRQHEGVDFAAPTGTPVYAAADGIVASARWERGYGRTIRLRHPGGVETVYAHLSRFAPETKAGERVRQGEVIGAVGSTGMSTGPHLHYEIRIAGRAKDPTRVALPTAEPLRGQQLAAFQERQQALARQLAGITVSRTEVALAE